MRTVDVVDRGARDGGASGTPVPAAAGRWAAVRPWVAVALTAAALAPVVVVLVTRTGRSYLPVQDLAVVDLRVRDVWSRNIPLVGPYSRGFSHPGPLMFWLLAIPSRLVGQPAWATLVGGALLQGVAVVAAARLAWRRGGLSLLLVVLGALLLSYPGAWMFLHPWNPNIALPYLPLFLLLVWAVAEGDRRMPVWAVVVGTFLVQTHIGYALLVLVPLAWAAVVVSRDAGGWRHLGRWRRPAVVAGAVAVVLWAPVVVEQVAFESGNLRRIWRYFTGSDEVAGMTKAAGLLATEFKIPPPWLDGAERFVPFRSTVRPSPLPWLLVLVALVGAAILAARRSPRPARRFVVLVGVALLTGLVAMAQLRGDLVPYLFQWRGTLAALFTGGVLWLGLRRLPGAIGQVSWRVAGVVATVLLVGRSLGLAQDVAEAERGRVLPAEPVARKIIDQLDEDVPDATVLVRGRGLLGLPEAVIDELDRRGAPMRVDEGLGYKWGRQRTATRDEVSSVWFVVEAGVTVSLVTDLPGARVLARLSPLDPAAEREVVGLQRRLAAQLHRAGRDDLLPKLDSSLAGFAAGAVRGVDLDALNRLAALNRVVETTPGCRCAVVAVPPGARGVDDVPATIDPTSHLDS